MDIRFDGKVALVTGAGSGIGAATACLLASSGATVLVADLNIDAARKVVAQITTSGGHAIAAGGDVSKAEVVESLVARAIELGGLHCLVNNAGIGGPNGRTADYPIDSWHKVIGVNMDSVFFGMRYGIPAMVRGGGGAVVNIASALGLVGFEKKIAYVGAKHAVMGMTRTAALDHARDGIRVNAIAPGFIDTPMLQKLDDARRQALISEHPVGRLGTAEEIASLVVFLVSDQASFLTGSCYTADGGYTAH